MSVEVPGQVWRAIKWGWKEYKVARLLGEGTKAVEAATRIRLLQEGIGIRRSTFEELGLEWPQFLEEDIPKDGTSSCYPPGWTRPRRTSQ